MKLINKSEIILPKFFDENLFVKILQNALPDNTAKYQVEKVEVSRGSNDGENYFSKILRVHIEYIFAEERDERVENPTTKLNELSVIVKYLPKDERRPFGENLNFFSKEIDMAVEILPKFEEILCTRNDLSAKLLYLLESPERIIVLEDLKTSGYALADRQVGIDETHAQLVLRKLAKFHAASLQLAKQKPDAMRMYDKGFFHQNNRETTLQKNIFEGNLKCIAEAVEQWPSYEKIAQKLIQLQPFFFDRCLAEETTNSDYLNVLNHSDLHLNNFMFKYDSNDQPVDVRFLDFQMCHYGSLGLDINYFFNTSLRIDVLREKRDDLLRYYYDTLMYTLSEIKFDEYISYEQILKCVREKEFFGFFAFEGILPTISMDPEYCKKANVDKFAAQEILEWRRRVMFSTDRYIETMKYCLKRFDRLGVLDS